MVPALLGPPSLPLVLDVRPRGRQGSAPTEDVPAVHRQVEARRASVFADPADPKLNRIFIERDQGPRRRSLRTLGEATSSNLEQIAAPLASGSGEAGHARAAT